MDSTQHVKNGRKLDVSGTPERMDTRTGQISPTVRSHPQPAGEIRPLLKSKHWRLLYASSRPGKPEGSPSPRENFPAGTQGREEDVSKHKGLCKNCAKRESCKLPRPEGGVWRCEDYE